MLLRKSRAQYTLKLEVLEDRVFLSGSSQSEFERSLHPVGIQNRSVYIASLTPAQVILPFDSGGVTSATATLPSQAVQPTQVEGGGGAELYPTPATSSDPAWGKIKLTITDGGREIKIVGTLHNISNVSAITVRDLRYPATSALRGSLQMPTGQEASIPPITALPASTGNTLLTTQGQILLSNTGQTVAVLLKPGMGSGPIINATFQNVIAAPYLEGPLAGQRLSALIKDMQAGLVYILVQTNDGYDPATGPEESGNYPFGELRGAVSLA